METQLSSPLTQDRADFLAAQVLVFGLLGRAVFEYPNREWLQSLATEGVFNELPLETDNADVAAGLARLQAWANSFSVDAFEALEADYTRLFVGPGNLLAPPWGSVYFTQDRLIFQEQTLNVRQWYLRFGLQVEKLYSEPDDHIGLELIFISHLAAGALNALESDDQTACTQLLEQQWDFLQEHPLQWAPKWCSDVLEFSQYEFYRGIAQLIKGVLAHTQAVFELHFKAA